MNHAVLRSSWKNQESRGYTESKLNPLVNFSCRNQILKFTEICSIAEIKVLNIHAEASHTYSLQALCESNA
jgi:hypothetical protein